MAERLPVLIADAEPASPGRPAVAPPAGRVRRGRKRRDASWPLLVAPGLALFALFVLYPLAQAVLTSFYDWDGFTEKRWVGLENYSTAFDTPLFWAATRHTVLYVVGTVVAKLALALVLALAADRAVRAAAAFRAILFWPALASFVAVGLLWSLLYDPSLGLVNQVLGPFGLAGDDTSWLGDPDRALASIMAVDVWKWTGYHFVLILAGLQVIAPELKDAARVDGASERQVLRHVVLPGLRPILVINVLIATAGGFNSFDLPFVMTGGGPYNASETLMTLMYSEAFANQRFGYASAIATLLFLGVALVTLALLRLLRSAEDTA